MKLYQVVMLVPDDFIPEELEMELKCDRTVKISSEGFIGPDYIPSTDGHPSLAEALVGRPADSSMPPIGGLGGMLGGMMGGMMGGFPPMMGPEGEMMPPPPPGINDIEDVAVKEITVAATDEADISEESISETDGEEDPNEAV